MTIVLATAWHPRGEKTRFRNLLPQLQDAYSGIAFSLPPGVETDLVEQLNDLPQVTAFITGQWSHGRYKAMQSAAKFAPEHVHYADFDRLLRWIETRPEEWAEVLKILPNYDCLIMGRSPASYQTHPNALFETESISNRVVSYLLGQTMDVSAGSKSFSLQACELILANSFPGNALGTDAEWPLILKKLGITVDYIEVDGLDWESADRFQDKAADPHSQRGAAKQYDAQPGNWSRRVAVAMEIVQVGLDTISRDFPENTKKRL
jgi:hypothetical protein